MLSVNMKQARIKLSEFWIVCGKIGFANIKSAGSSRIIGIIWAENFLCSSFDVNCFSKAIA